MINKTRQTLLAFSVYLLSTPIFAATNYVITQTPSKDFSLHYNDPQPFDNQYYWTFNILCVISNHDVNNTIRFKMLRKSGVLNNIRLSAGESMELKVKSGDKFHVVSSAGSKVELVNLDEKTVNVSCSIE